MKRLVIPFSSEQCTPFSITQNHMLSEIIFFTPLWPSLQACTWHITPYLLSGMSNTPVRCKGDGKSVHKLDKCMREWNIYSSRWKLQAYLINTTTHCRTPATPVQTEGPLFVSASCTNKPTDPARQTKETTYATKSQSFTLQCKETKVRIFYAGITGKNPSYTLNSIWAHSSTQKLV